MLPVVAVLLAAAPPAPGSFAYVLQAESLGDRPAAVAALAGCGRDWIVIDAAYTAGTPWAAADLEAIRRGKAGRKVIAYLSVGEAEEYRPYWQKAWGTGGKRTPAAPPWLLAENPDWKGNYRVKYWDEGWQKLILPAVGEAIGRGFDGVYLDIVDGFETFERDGEKFLDDRVNPETKRSYRRDMVEWVKAIAAAARAANPAALVVPQNGSQLLAHPDFLAAVSGVGVEDTFTDDDKAQPADHTRFVLANLKPLLAAGKPVLAIEYPTRADRRTAVREKAAAAGLVWLVTDRPLKTLGTSGR